MSLDVVLLVRSSEVERAAILLESLKKFFRFPYRLVCIGPEEQLADISTRLQAVLPAAEFIAETELYAPQQRSLDARSWRVRMALAASRRVTSPWYLLLRPDCYAVREIEEADLLERFHSDGDVDAVVSDEPRDLAAAAISVDSVCATPLQMPNGPALLHRQTAKRAFLQVQRRGISGIIPRCTGSCSKRRGSCRTSTSPRCKSSLTGNDLLMPASFLEWNPGASFGRKDYLFTIADQRAGAPPAWLRSQLGPYFSSGKRDWSRIVAEFHQRELTRIVEIGSLRLKNDFEGNGCGTLVWAQHGEEVWTVDINPAATSTAAEETSHYGTVRTVTADGIEFLRNFEGPIDLLYLDGWDCGTPDGKYVPESAKQHLEAYKAARKKLHSKSLVVIDDTLPDGRGKGELAIPLMCSEGWEVLENGYQTVLTRSRNAW